MPRETVAINLTSLPVYEAGGVFLAWVAHPGTDEETKRERLYRALCREAIIQLAEGDAEFAWKPQALKPGFFIMGTDEARRVLKEGSICIRDRMTAAAWRLLPFIKQKLIGIEIKVEGLRLTAENMAIFAADDLGWKEGNESNVKTRIFKPTRPVIHAAAALANAHLLWRQHFPRRPFTVGYLLRDRLLLETIVHSAETCRELLPKLANPKISEQETIQFILQ